MIDGVEMGMLAVQQAVFGSTDRGRVKGYQLLARSSGIDAEAALQLTRWAPTQLPDDACEDWNISSWPLENGMTVVSRTVFGGPEYSNRGGAQVVTLFLVLTEDQFRCYEYDAVAVATTAQTLGFLRLPTDLRHETVAEARLPDRPIIDPDLLLPPMVQDAHVASLLSDVADVLARSGRVAVVGITDPLCAVRCLTARMKLEQRRWFSFTTGLSPSIRRPVNAHFYQRPDVARQHALEAQDVLTFNAIRLVPA